MLIERGGKRGRMHGSVPTIIKNKFFRAFFRCYIAGFNQNFLFLKLIQPISIRYQGIFIYKIAILITLQDTKLPHRELKRAIWLTIISVLDNTRQQKTHNYIQQLWVYIAIIYHISYTPSCITAIDILYIQSHRIRWNKAGDLLYRGPYCDSHLIRRSPDFVPVIYICHTYDRNKEI